MWTTIGAYPSLLSIISKCYTSILNKRLYAWLEENDKISECQAGFRKKYSTVDQIFNLYAIVQKCLSQQGKKLYVAFVDFKKAFDSVRHDKLLECVRNEGVTGRFFGSLRAMYNSLLSCIKIDGQCSEFFECPIGVRQGCVMSPTLFSMFINQISSNLSESGRHGVQLLPGIMELFILLFADDVALISSTPIGLQNQLNVLKTCCDDMKMRVNIQKTKVMVFRKGGFLGKREEWYFENNKLEVVNRYCYLGYTFTTMISPKLGIEHLVVKGKRALMSLVKAFQKYKEISCDTFFKIFDAKIKPILLYSSEIWGMNRLDHIEKVHLLACKRFLGVPIKTPNKMVYGDLGRYPLFVNSYVNTLRYWFKLLQMDQDRLPRQAYLMLLRLDEGGRSCWVSKVRSILCETGFELVWLHQGVGHVKSFLVNFRHRLIDMFTREWCGSLQDSDRYACYRSFKSVFEKEKYLYTMDIYCFRVALSQLRFNVLPLNNNVNRYNDDPQKRLCPFCKSFTENEEHLIFHCFVYTDLRSKLLQYTDACTLQTLCSVNDQQRNTQLSKFIFKSMKRRSELLLYV